MGVPACIGPLTPRAFLEQGFPGRPGPDYSFVRGRRGLSPDRFFRVAAGGDWPKDCVSGLCSQWVWTLVPCVEPAKQAARAMIDLKLVRDDPERCKRAAALKKSDVDVDAILDLDGRRRGLVARVDELKARRNTESKRIGELRKGGHDATEAMDAVRIVGEEIKELDRDLAAVGGGAERPSSEAAQPARGGRPRGKHGGGQPRGAAPRRTSCVFVHPEESPGAGRGARHPGSSGRGPHVRHRVFLPPGGRRPAGARVDRLHDRPPREGARLPRGAESIPGAPSRVRGHGSAAQAGR